MLLDAESAQAAVALGVRLRRAEADCPRVAVSAEAELREDQRPLRRRQLLDRSADDFLGMAGP